MKINKVAEVLVVVSQKPHSGYYALTDSLGR